MGKEKKSERLFTEVELELMNALWDLGEGTVKDILACLPSGRKLAYTSVATMMKILEGKGAVASRKGERVYTYVPRIARGEYEGRALRHVAERVFQGRPSTMVMRLLDEAELSKEELKSIRKLLEERLKS
jgi:predicted transcriptional regulator